MSIDCCFNAGGRFRITINGRVWSARGAATIQLANYERTVESNSDGSIYMTTKPMPYTIEATFSDGCGISPAELMSCPADVTVELIDLKRIYIMTDAVAVGRPSLNTETGEITGVNFTSMQLQQIET